MTNKYIKTDDYYGSIYIAPEHLEAWRKEFSTRYMAELSVIEEMSELTQALCKMDRINSRGNRDEDEQARKHLREEFAHVLISLKGLAFYYDCSLQKDLVEKEIQKKWPGAYEPKRPCCENCYWSYLVGGLDVDRLCQAKDNAKVDNGYCCKGFAPKEDRDE